MITRITADKLIIESFLLKHQQNFEKYKRNLSNIFHIGEVSSVKKDIFFIFFCKTELFSPVKKLFNCFLSVQTK